MVLHPSDFFPNIGKMGRMFIIQNDSPLDFKVTRIHDLVQPRFLLWLVHVLLVAAGVAVANMACFAQDFLVDLRIVKC